MPKLTAFQRDVLKLAKAMEQGIKKTRPSQGEYIIEGSNKVVYACALGAAFVNGYSLKRSLVDGERDVQSQLDKRFPALCGTQLFHEVIDRNDMRDWPRGRIVHWLRRVAAKYSESNQDAWAAEYAA